MNYDAVAVMDSGNVIEYGAPEELSADPESAFSQLLQASMGKGEDEL
jgi:ABC-type multidrug transport system fused ATPase/permease subunit